MESHFVPYRNYSPNKILAENWIEFLVCI